MSILTPFFNLIKPAKTDPTAIAQINANMDTIDTEMHKPPLTVNEIEPDPTTRNIPITTVPLADNLTSDEAQINTGTFIIRTSGGEASIKDGAAMMADIQGNMVKTGYVAESITPTFVPSSSPGNDPISDISVDRDTFVTQFVAQSDTSPVVFTYSSDWDVAPSSYGITFSGTPVSGDKISVAYVAENRGTITTASPSSFISTGWNLYNHASGYARVIDYSEQYGFMISGTYTALKFASTLTGTQSTITPVDGYFTVPSDGYLFVTGGNDTDTAIWMTWSDWTEEAVRTLESEEGDCYSYYSLSKAFFEYFGIENVGIRRSENYEDAEEDGTHFWCVVNVEEGWYYYDATRLAGTFDDGSRNACLITEAKLKSYRGSHGEDYFYKMIKPVGFPQISTKELD